LIDDDGPAASVESTRVRAKSEPPNDEEEAAAVDEEPPAQPASGEEGDEASAVDEALPAASGAEEGDEASQTAAGASARSVKEEVPPAPLESDDAYYINMDPRSDDDGASMSLNADYGELTEPRSPASIANAIDIVDMADALAAADAQAAAESDDGREDAKAFLSQVSAEDSKDSEGGRPRKRRKTEPKQVLSVKEELLEDDGQEDAFKEPREGAEDSKEGGRRRKRRREWRRTRPWKRRRTEPEQVLEPEAAPAEPAAAAASTRGPTMSWSSKSPYYDEPAAAAASTRGPLRRQIMKSRIVVDQYEGTERYTLVRAPREMEALINNVILLARDRAIVGEANEISESDGSFDGGMFGDSTPEKMKAYHYLVQCGRAIFVPGGRRQNRADLRYLVLDAALAKRCKYEAFLEWASSNEGYHHLSKQDPESGELVSMPLESRRGPFVIPQKAKNKFRCYCDQFFGGQTWFDVLIQIGGCPAEFVDAWNAVINERREVAF